MLASFGNNIKMNTIDNKTIITSLHYFNTLKLEERIKLNESIQQKQPHAFLTVLALSQEGVSLEKMDHILNILCVIYLLITKNNSIKLPVVSKQALLKAYKNNIAMLRFIEIEEDGKLKDEIFESYPEKFLLVYLIGCLKEIDLLKNNKECNMIITTLKVVLDSLIKAKNKMPN